MIFYGEFARILKPFIPFYWNWENSQDFKNHSFLYICNKVCMTQEKAISILASNLFSICTHTYSRKHGLGAREAAPMSDVAQHGDMRGTSLPARWCHIQHFFFNSRQLSADSGQFTLNWADSHRLRPYWEKPLKCPKQPIQTEIQ